MNNIINFAKPEISPRIYNVTPEQVVCLEIARNMNRAGKRSFASYLKSVECEYIQRGTITVEEVAALLEVSVSDAYYLLRTVWREDGRGTFSQVANLSTFYFNQVIEVVS